MTISNAGRNPSLSTADDTYGFDNTQHINICHLHLTLILLVPICGNIILLTWHGLRSGSSCESVIQ